MVKRRDQTQAGPARDGKRTARAKLITQTRRQARTLKYRNPQPQLKG